MDLCKHCGQRIALGPYGWTHISEAPDGTHSSRFCELTNNRTLSIAEPQQQGE